MSDPLREYQSLIEAAKDAQRILAPTQHLAEQVAKSSAFLAMHRSGMAEAIMEMQRRHDLLTSGLGIQRMIDQVHATQELASQMALQYRTTLASIDNQTIRWRSLVEPMMRHISEVNLATKHFAGMADSFVAWESSTTKLAQRFSEIGLVGRNAALANRLLAPTRVFSDFAETTLALIDQSKDVRRIHVLETSLRLAEEQLFATTDSLNEIVVVPDDGEDTSLDQELNSLHIQQEELLASAEEHEETDEADFFQTSAATNAVDLSRNVLSSIATCNEARKVAGVDEIFKPTTRLLEVYVDLPWLMPTDKESFARFVDCLYFLFYEGAGKDNLRFLRINGGPIDDTDFDFVLCIKHLRNKWTRHDADHGKDTEIKKSWAELSRKFQWLGLEHFPVSREDFRLLHMNLLIMATQFMNKIIRGTIGP